MRCENKSCLIVQVGMWEARFILIPIKQGGRWSLLIVSGHHPKEEAPVILHLNPVAGERTSQSITEQHICTRKRLGVHV